MKRFIFLFSFLLFFSAETTFALEYNIEPYLSLSEAYNDNIFLSEDRVDDFITFITPGIDLSMKSAISELRIGYSPSFSYYRSWGELNDTAHRFGASGDFTLSERLHLALTDTYVRSSEMSDFRDIPDLGPITKRAELRLHSTEGEISYRLRENLTCTLGASYHETNYKVSDLPEVKTYSGNIDFSYRYTERTTFTIDAKYSRDDFRSFSDDTRQEYMLGATHRFSPVLSASFEGGVVITKIEDIGESDTGFNGYIELTRGFEKGNASISYRQAVIVGVMTVQPIKDRTVKLRLTRDITNKLTASISASHSYFESIETDNIESDETTFRTEVAYNLRPWAVLSLSYWYTDFDNRITDTGYYNNIVFLNLRLSYNKRL